MKKLLFGAFVVSLAAATPARAQGDRPVHLNIGGGATMPISDVSDRFGTGGGFNLGVIIEPTPTFGLQIEYAYNTLSGESKTIPVTFPEPQAILNGTALIESHHKMHYIDFNGILQTSGESIVKPYAHRRLRHVLPQRQPDDAGRRVHHVVRPVLVRVLSGGRPGRSHHR